MGIKFNPFTSNFDIVDEGGSFFGSPVANKTALDLITTDTDGTVRITLDTNDAYRWNLGSLAWQYVGKVKAGSFGSSPNSSGFSVATDNTVTLQPANASNPGAVSTTTQTFSGNKTFSGTILADSSVDVTATGGTDTLNIGTANADIINIGRSGATVNVQGTTLYQDVTNLNVTDKLFTVNKGGSAGSGTSSGFEIEENALATGYVKTSGDRNSWLMKAPNTAGDITLTPGASGITLDQSSHDPVTLAAVGSSPNSNGASLSTQQLTLQPADGSNPGLITAGTQTIGGAKTFSSTISASNLSGTNTGDVTINDTNSVNLSLTGQSLTADVRRSDTTIDEDASGIKVGSNSLTNTHINSSAGIAYSKLNLSNSIVNADIASGAAIAVNKLAALTANRAVVSDSSGFISSATTTDTEIGFVNGVTSSIQTQLNNRLLKASGDINETSFSAANNQSLAADVTGLAFANGTVRSFEALVSVALDATSDLFEQFTLKGIQRGSDWQMSQSSIGDDSGFDFSITNAGQVQYVSGNASGFVSATTKFRAITTSV